MLHVENDDPEHKEVQMHCGTSTFYLSKSLLEMSQLSNAILNIETQEEPGPPLMNSEKEELLKDVLYSVNSLMGKSGQWKVKENNKMFGIASKQEAPTTVVTLPEVTQYLQDTFHTDEHTLQGLREEVQSRKPAEFCLNLTVLEADVQFLKDCKLKGSTNFYVRIRLGPKLLEEYDTPQIKGTRYPKWKHDMKLKLWDLYSDYLVIQLWHEKEEDTRKRRHLIPGYLQEPIKPELLADISLPLKETLESGITGWYDLQNHLESKMSVTARVHLSGHISCVSDVKFNNQEAYDTLIRCFIDLQINNSSQDTDQVRSTGDYWREESMPANARAVLSQFSLILNLSKASQLLSWWNNVTNMSSPIDWDLVLAQFNCIKASLVMRYYSTEEEQYLTSAISRIIDNCIRDVKYLEKCFPVAFPDRSESQLSSLLSHYETVLISVCLDLQL